MSGRFRNGYRILTDDERLLVSRLKFNAEVLEHIIDEVPMKREMELALTKLEEAVMWAVKGVTG